MHSGCFFSSLSYFAASIENSFTHLKLHQSDFQFDNSSAYSKIINFHNKHIILSLSHTHTHTFKNALIHLLSLSRNLTNIIVLLTSDILSQVYNLHVVIHGERKKTGGRVHKANKTPR